MPGTWVKARRGAVCLLAALIMIMVQTGCGDNYVSGGQSSTSDKVARDSFYFDTICSITVYDMDEMSQENAEAAISEAFHACAEYENLLSRTKEGTDIYRVNHAGGESTEVSPETAELIRMSILFCEVSGGKFDITVGRLSDLWDFHAEEPVVPDKEDIQKALETVGYSGIEITDTPDGKTEIALANPEAAIDLGGIAKGYIADRICEVLRKKGVKSAVVSLGGNIACIGAKSVGKDGETTPFTVGVETPFSHMTEIIGTIPCENRTVVTSGIYERYFEKDGVFYHHILDAGTGYPCETDVVGVTVTAQEGHSMECDALATICLLLGAERGMAMIEDTEGVEALFVTEEGITLSSGMEFVPIR